MLSFLNQPPKGLFGKSNPSRSRNPVTGEDVQLPGAVIGYGGGTFNPDGSVATPVDRLGEGGPSDMFARSGDGATATAWDQPTQQQMEPIGDAGFPIARQYPDAEPADVARPARGGVFGKQPFPRTEAMGQLPRKGGASGFDYDAALTSMLPQQKKRSTLQKIAGVVAPVLMGLGGNQAGANAFFANQQSRRDADERQRNSAISTIERWKYDDFARRQGADLRAGAPRVIGRSMVQFDPNSGGVNELYDGPEDFETYAETMGLEPGSQEYFDAVEDYVLKSDGPAAYERDTGLDDYRTGNRLKIEGARQGNRLGLEDVRQRNRITTKGSPTYRDSNPAPRRGSARPTATGPNGQKVEWDGKAWVPSR